MSNLGLKWKLNDILTDEQVSVYALNQRLVEAGRAVSRTTLYRLASEQPERIDLEVTDLLDQAAVTADVEEIEEDLAEVQRKLVEDLAVYPTVTVMKALARQPCTDLGYEPVATMTDFYALTVNTRILAE